MSRNINYTDGFFFFFFCCKVLKLSRFVIRSGNHVEAHLAVSPSHCSVLRSRHAYCVSETQSRVWNSVRGYCILDNRLPPVACSRISLQRHSMWKTNNAQWRDYLHCLGFCFVFFYYFFFIWCVLRKKCSLFPLTRPSVVFKWNLGSSVAARVLFPSVSE